MAFPKIKISYLNGMLGTVSETADGLFALVSGAVAVSTTFVLNKAYTLTRLADLVDLGITSSNNAKLYKYVSEFYSEAAEGTKVVIMGVDPTKKKSELMSGATYGVIGSLIKSLNGKLNGIFVGGNTIESPSVSASAAQTLANWSTTSLYAPLFVVFDTDFTQDDIEMGSPNTFHANRVAFLAGDTTVSSDTSCLGILAGRLASVGVQRNCGRVKDGALSPDKMYVGTLPIEINPTFVETTFDAGFIIPRCYVGRSGYFFADDQTAVEATDDYSHISLRRVIDKAYRITYNTLLDMMLDELEVNEDGTLQVGIVKSWQSAVEGAINRQMTAQGELSSNNGEEGCECYIDATQNVVSTSKINITVKVRPFGYARMIEVNLGFAVSNS